MAQVLVLQIFSVRVYIVNSPPTDKELRQLLLRQLPAQAAEAIEDRLVLEDSVAERLQHLQYALLDDYARGRLSQDERLGVEKYLLRTQSERDRAYLAQGLMRAAQQRRISGSKLPGIYRVLSFRPARRGVIALVASLLVVAALAVYFAPVSLLPRAVQTDERLAVAAAPATPLSPSTPASALYQLTLLADATRGSSVAELSLPAGVLGLRLQAQIQSPGPASRYRLTVLDAQSKTLFLAANLDLQHADGLAYVQTLVPASVISPGQLRIRIESQDAAGSAAFSFTWTLQAS